MLIFAVAIISCSEQQKPIDVYMIGDSTMANKKENKYPETGWGQVLDSFLIEKATVKNHAVNGRSSKSFIDEGRWQTVVDSLETGDYVLIQFGHNDKKDYDSTRYTVPFGSYADNLRKFVNESREKGAKPVLFTSIVRRHFDENEKLIDTHLEYPEATLKVAEELDVPVVDLETLTKELIESMGDEASKGLFLHVDSTANYPAGKKDDTHLNREGAYKIASMAAEEIEKLNIPLSNYVDIE